MNNDPAPLDLGEYKQGRVPRAPKRKVKADPDDPVVQEAREAAKRVIDSRKFAGKSIEDIAELAIRRQANAVLLGGDEFLPVSLKEASDVAKIWTAIASSERARLHGHGRELSADDPAVQLRNELEALRNRKKDE